MAGTVSAALSGDDDDNDKAAKPTTEQRAASNGASAGQLTAGGQSLLPMAQAGDLDGSVGQDAQGRAVVVQSFVRNQGFWVGTSKQNRLYVEYGGNTGENEPGGQPNVGTKVNLTGPVKAAPKDPGKTLNLVGDDAAQVKEQGAYVNADTVKAAA